MGLSYVLLAIWVRIFLLMVPIYICSIICTVMYTDYCGVLLLHIRVCRCLHIYQLAASNYTFCCKTCSTFN